MQQPPPMIPMMPSFPPSSITSEQIQKYLDENKTLILAILDHQNLGKLAECAQYQAKLQKNLMYLAAIADAQPQSPAIPTQVAIPTQMAPHPAMQQGGFYMQHPQAAAMTQQQGIFTSKMPLQFNNPQQLQDQQQHQHQQLQRQQQGMQLGGANSGMHSTIGGASNSSQLTTSGEGDARGGNKQDKSKAKPSGADGQASSVTAQGSEEPK